MRVGCHFLPLTLLLMLAATPAQSHDPSAWGGLFRSRDNGATWVSANRVGFVSGAIALAISPTDVNHLLLGSESGLLRSRNGGRDWTIEAPAVVVGPVFALAFEADGQRPLVSTGSRIFRDEPEKGWQQAPAPHGATPARAIIRSDEAGRVYLAGWTGLFRSDNWGASWSNAGVGLPEEPPTTFVAMPGSPETLYAVVQGRMWRSVDGARTWTSPGAGILPSDLDALGVDPTHPTRLWAAGGDRLFRSDNGGANWRRSGQPLPEANTTVHGVTGNEETIVVTTDRGLYRTVDGGDHWTLIIDNLPAHLEAGPLVRDPVDPGTLYAGFALVPYSELWRRAANREGALARVSFTSLAGGLLLLVVVGLGAFAALRWLGQYYYRPSNVPATGISGRRIEKTLP
jgi:photosystem II stability/assembly factor-like uncharacterized protein